MIWKEIMVVMIVSFLGKTEGTTTETPIRLVGGKYPWEGRVEIEYNGQWGTICDDQFGIDDTKVVCRMLGYNYTDDADDGSIAYYHKAHFGPGDGPILIDDLDCSGEEDDISECDRRPWFVNDCKHKEDASVNCRVGQVPRGFCGFPCTLHNKTYELCHCDVNNVNQSYSVGVNDTTLFTENFGGENKTDWECYTRSGRFYVVRRCIASNVYEYRCMRDIMYNTTKDLRVYCMSEWAQFPGNPSLCDVCDGSAFDKDKALIIKEQSEQCGTIILPPRFCGCALPTICPVTNNVTQTQCDACESSEGNDDGLCCS